MANDDKMFDLIEKLYIEMQEGFKRIDLEMQEGFKRVDSEMQQGFRRIENKIESDIEPKISALFDGYKQVSENITEMKDTLKEISKKVDNQEVEIRVLKAVK